MSFTMSAIAANAFIRVLRVCNPALMLADEIGTVDRLNYANDTAFRNAFMALFPGGTATLQQLSNPPIYDINVASGGNGDTFFDIPCEVKNLYALIDSNFVRGIECNEINIEDADANDSAPLLENFGTGCAFTINAQNRRRCTILIQTFGVCLTITQQPDRGACPECRTGLLFRFPIDSGCYRIMLANNKLGGLPPQFTDARFVMRPEGEKILIRYTDFKGNIQESIPAPFYLFNEKINSENDVSITAHNLKRNLFSRQSRSFEFETGQLPAYTHAYLSKMMTSDRCEIQKIWLDDFQDRPKRVILTKDSKQEYDAGPPKRLSKGEGELQVSDELTVNEYD